MGKSGKKVGDKNHSLAALFGVNGYFALALMLHGVARICARANLEREDDAFFVLLN